MRHCLVLFLPLVALACNREQATVSPDPAPPMDAQAAAPEPAGPAEADPALIAAYQAMVNEVYSRDAQHCLEDQMEAEDSRYMRSAFTLTITVAGDGTTKEVNADNVGVQIRNYEGDVLGEGNVEGMTECLLEHAREWEYEPLPPGETTFSVGGGAGD